MRCYCLRCSCTLAEGKAHEILSPNEQEPETVLNGDSNPGPTAQIEFWADKSHNLNLVHDQLNGEKVRRVMKVLEVTKTTYFPAFNRLCKEVAQSRMEVSFICADAP